MIEKSDEYTNLLRSSSFLVKLRTFQTQTVSPVPSQSWDLGRLVSKLTWMGEGEFSAFAECRGIIAFTGDETSGGKIIGSTNEWFDEVSSSFREFV